MERLRLVVVAVVTAGVLGSSGVAVAAPTRAGAEAAVERKVEQAHRRSLGHGEQVLADCRHRVVKRTEVRFRCEWMTVGGRAFLSGMAWAYGKRSGAPRWFVVLLR